MIFYRKDQQSLAIKAKLSRSRSAEARLSCGVFVPLRGAIQLTEDLGAKRLIVLGNFEGLSTRSQSGSLQVLTRFKGLETPLTGARRIHLTLGFKLSSMIVVNKQDHQNRQTPVRNDRFPLNQDTSHVNTTN